MLNSELIDVMILPCTLNQSLKERNDELGHSKKDTNNDNGVDRNEKDSDWKSNEDEDDNDDEEEDDDDNDDDYDD